MSSLQGNQFVPIFENLREEADSLRGQTNQNQFRASLIVPNDITTPFEGTAIEFDASVNETHTGSAEATQFPVEEGADITDHIRRLPEELSINVITSNSPIFVDLNDAPRIEGASSVVTRAEATYTFLKTAKDNGSLVSFVTTLRRYRSMYIQTLSCSRDAATSDIVNINLTLREIIIATTQQVAAPDIQPPGRQGKSDQGIKPKKDTTVQTGADVVKLKSGAAKLLGAIF